MVLLAAVTMGVVVHAACVAVDPCFAWGATTTAASCVDVVLFDRWRRAHRRLLIAPPTTLLRRVGLFMGVGLAYGFFVFLVAIDVNPLYQALLML